MKPNLHKIENFFKKKWFTIVLLIVIAFLLVSCGSVKKHKTTELKEQEKTEVVEKKENSESESETEKQSEKQSEKTQTDKRDSETSSDRTVTADEVFIDKYGNLSAKGNVLVNETKTEKTSEKTDLNEKSAESENSVTNEKIKSDKSENSKLKESSREKTTNKQKESKSSVWIDLWWLWLLLVLIGIFVIYRKVKNRTTLF